MLRPVFMGYIMGYSMGSILRAILGRPYDSTVLMTPAATLQVCGLFKSAYFDAKARSSTEVADNPWDLQSGALFALGQFTTVSSVYGDNAECTATRWGHGVVAS